MPIAVIAMPLLSTGDAAVDMVDMLEPLVTAASAWMMAGLPISRLMIIERAEQKAYEAKGAFALLKNICRPHPMPESPDPVYPPVYRVKGLPGRVQYRPGASSEEQKNSVPCLPLKRRTASALLVFLAIH